MKIVGKKNHEEIQELKAKFIDRDRKYHIGFERLAIAMYILMAVVSGMVFEVILMCFNGTRPLQWDCASRWMWVLLWCAIAFIVIYLLMRQPYKFNEDSVFLPKTYRYFMLTDGKNIVREEVRIIHTEDGSLADLNIITLNDKGEKECGHVGAFPIELKRNIEESVLDLEKEKMYVPYNADDVKFAEDNNDEEGS